MMVTFISQCEKKALPRTRRVLDAFANRIGSNTWQTVITQEGLLAVKKLLRKTASKNTAVSCHWIRSRARTDLLWIVGNKRKFNNLGHVPVNITSKEVIMDKLPIETQHILANTKQQPLSHHLFAVGYLAFYLIKKMNIADDNKLAQTAFITGLLHDIGKIDPQFQNWVNKKVKKETSDLLPEDGFHIDTSIQGHSKFTFEKHPRHNEISWLLSESFLMNDNSDLNPSQKQQIFHGVYWHHTKPFRKDNSYFENTKGIHKLFSKSLNPSSINEIYEQAIAVIKESKAIAKNFESDNEFCIEALLPQFNFTYELEIGDLPAYKIYEKTSDTFSEYKKDIKVNALNNLIRTAVISADRIVSQISAEDLTEYLNEGSLLQALASEDEESIHLLKHIEKCLSGFENRYPNSDRNVAQSQAADKLAELKEIAEFEDNFANIGVLQGPAGCGKTKITLEWALKTKAEKIIWICPRVQVCLGLFNDLTQTEYLPKAKVEILTGEFKNIVSVGNGTEQIQETPEDDYFTGDIVITTIDQVIKNIISHQNVTAMVGFMQSHIVFDEFHELIPMEAFNLLFAELIEAKRMQRQHANTLLVSATPHDYFVTEVLDLDKRDIIRVESFNKSTYQINLQSYDEKEEQNPLMSQIFSNEKKTFVITNTARDAQISFLRHQTQEKNILLHSKYIKQDKKYWFEKVFNCFKKDGNSEYNVLRSGPIVQASLNISCDFMLTELTNAENWLQRLGRLDRFGENEDINEYITIIPKSSENGKQTSNTAKFLNRLHSWQSTVAWLDFLKDKLSESNIVTLNDLYKIYEDFYEDPKSQKKIEADLLKALKESQTLINDKIIDPISVPPKLKRSAQSVIKIAKNSLRGNNRFVQMAVALVDENLSPVYLDEYAYPEDTDHATETVGLTASVSSICGYDDSEKSLVAFMKAKHHNIKPEGGVKKAYKDFILLNKARSPEHPIYLSYTPKDLEPIGGKPFSYAMYYVKSNKQPVGAMMINTIIDNKPTQNINQQEQ